MRKDAAAAAESVPLPLPLAEGSRSHFALAAAGAKGKARGGTKARGRVAKGKEAGDVVLLIQEQKWESALTVATEAISKNPEDAEMYLHRAYCEMHFERYADGVLDCTRSIEIKRSEKAFRMRAACWLRLGEGHLATLDIDEAIGQGLPSAIPKKARQHEPSFLRGPASPQVKSAKPTAK
jgi:tetratricopeptide (TPR) repeat protein